MKNHITINKQWIKREAFYIDETTYDGS